MDDGDALLRAMLADPGDATPRLVYADWLEERGDARAGLLRADWSLDRASYSDWVLRTFPERAHAFGVSRLPAGRGEYEANEAWRLAAGPAAAAHWDWLAAVDTLGREFRPFAFFNNLDSRPFGDGELPLSEVLGTRGPLVTFESAFRGKSAHAPGLLEDLGRLANLGLSFCEYGRARCPTHPFACEFNESGRALTPGRLLKALKAGGLPGAAQIHADDALQSMFPRPAHAARFQDDHDYDGVLSRSAALWALKRSVVRGKLWYAALRRPNHPWALLLAVGRSRRGDRLLGAATHQAADDLAAGGGERLW